MFFCGREQIRTEQKKDFLRINRCKCTISLREVINAI